MGQAAPSRPPRATGVRQTSARLQSPRLSLSIDLSLGLPRSPVPPPGGASPLPFTSPSRPARPGHAPLAARTARARAQTRARARTPPAQTRPPPPHPRGPATAASPPAAGCPPPPPPSWKRAEGDDVTRAGRGGDGVRSRRGDAGRTRPRVSTGGPGARGLFLGPPRLLSAGTGGRWETLPSLANTLFFSLKKALPRPRVRRPPRGGGSGRVSV